MVQRQRGLDQARRSCGSVQMADVGFHRANPAKPRLLRGFAIGFGQGRHLNWITQIGAGAMALHIIHRVRARICQSQRIRHRCRLTAHRRGEIPGFVRAIIVDR
ncbi:hypothetical protein SHM7688_00552 [Shimia marina]|uniref:Uncharacterized protein n=1 Tax=Shimia marina TaxID=321267 RepID=A0A0P1F9M9_9RHOB|nr:hypothetical protein SHM7688_00552 [Shimia marina]